MSGSILPKWWELPHGITKDNTSSTYLPSAWNPLDLSIVWSQPCDKILITFWQAKRCLRAPPYFLPLLKYSLWRISAQILRNWNKQKQQFLGVSYIALHDKILFKAHYFCTCFTDLPVSVYIGPCNQYEMQSEDTQCLNSLHWSRQIPWRGLNSLCISFSAHEFSHLFLPRFPTLFLGSHAWPHCCYKSCCSGGLTHTRTLPFPAPHPQTPYLHTGENGWMYRCCRGPCCSSFADCFWQLL